jgi:RNA polymerase sigma factor (sigma-70 family)
VSSAGSVTYWLSQVEQGDPAAAQQLWERYFRRLVGFARTKLQGTSRRMADEEDVALSAFNSFWRNAERGKFPQLVDRDSLWRLLVVITARKAIHLLRDEGRQKRGGGVVCQTGSSDVSGLEPAVVQVLSREPTPEFAAQLAEDCQRLIKSLDDRELESIALWKLEGFSVEEIAEKLDCAPRTVKRKLQLIRSIWENGARPP